MSSKIIIVIVQLDTLGPWAESCPELERAPVLLLAALVKEFFRALPQPLLSADLYPAWLQVLSKYNFIIRLPLHLLFYDESWKKYN